MGNLDNKVAIITGVNAGVLDKGLNAIDRIDYDGLNRVIDIN